MPKKAVQKPTEEVQTSRKNNKKNTPAEPVAEAEAVAQAEVAPAKNKRASKKKVEATTAPTADSTAPTSDSTSKTRHVPTRESVEKEFDELVASIDEEINKLRSSTAKAKGVKFLRSVNKRVKALRNHALRVSKQRQSTRRSNTNSGFLKPVQISKDLASFIGWDAAQLRSRVEVTKYICDYVKQHNLQDPTDKRIIRVENDPKLKKLLKFEGKEPLKYYSLQTYLKNHFLPAPETAPQAEQTGKKAKAQ